MRAKRVTKRRVRSRLSRVIRRVRRSRLGTRRVTAAFPTCLSARLLGRLGGRKVQPDLPPFCLLCAFAFGGKPTSCCTRNRVATRHVARSRERIARLEFPREPSRSICSVRGKRIGRDCILDIVLFLLSSAPLSSLACPSLIPFRAATSVLLHVYAHTRACERARARGARLRGKLKTVTKYYLQSWHVPSRRRVNRRVVRRPGSSSLLKRRARARRPLEASRNHIVTGMDVLYIAREEAAAAAAAATRIA